MYSHLSVKTYSNWISVFCNENGSNILRPVWTPVANLDSLGLSGSDDSIA